MPNPYTLEDIGGLQEGAILRGFLSKSLGETGGIQPSGPSPYVDVRSYGAVADALTANNPTDLAPAVALAAAALPSSGGTIYIPAGVWQTNSNLAAPLANRANIRLLGDGANHAVYWGAPSTGTVIVAGGVLASLCDWKPTTAPESVRGCGIEGITFDGSGITTTPLKLASFYGGLFRDIHVRGGTTSQIALSTVDLAGVEDLQECTFELISARGADTASAKGITLSSWAAGGGNVSVNTFRRIILITTNGTGLEIGDSDTNLFEGVLCNRGGSAIGIDLLAANHASSGHARHNIFLHVDAVGGITSRATGFTLPAQSNYVLLSRGNSTPLPTIEAGSTLHVQDTRGRTINVMPQYRVETPVKDDFYVGSTGAGTGVIGELGGSVTNGSFSYLAPVAGHPGIIRLDTSAVATTVCAWTPNNNGGAAFLASELFDITFVIRLNQNDTDTQIRAGVQGSGTGDSSSNGVYFEKVYAEVTNWKGAAQAGGARTNTAAVAALSTNWVTLRVRQVAVGTVGFTVDGGTEVTTSTNVPGAVAVQPFLQIKNQSAVSKTIDLDYFEQRISGLSRT